MKKSHLETLPKETEIIDDILCNMCGESCKIAENEFNGLIEHELYGGYNSCGAGLIDLTSYKFSICETCLVKLFDQFKIEPVIISYGDHPCNLAEHRQCVAERLESEQKHALQHH